MTARLPFDPIARARENWRARGWAAPDAMAAVTSITRAHQVLMARIEAVLRPLDLTFARYEVLVLLTFSRRGSLPLGKIGERLQVSPASVTNAIDRLEASGFVVRTPHPTDGRTTLAAITDRGQDVLDEATRALTTERFGARGLDDDESREVFDLLVRFRAEAGDFTP